MKKFKIEYKINNRLRTLFFSLFSRDSTFGSETHGGFSQA